MTKKKQKPKASRVSVLLGPGQKVYHASGNGELLVVNHRSTHDTLELIELEVVDMQRICEAAENTLQHTAAVQLDPKMRNELAQLHGNANKLLATRIDAILTSAPPLARLAGPGPLLPPVA